jgi:hypothetical protein
MKGKVMKIVVTQIATIVVMLLLSVATAKADSWSRSWTGPYGVERSATGGCGYHGCGYNMQATGPNGQTWSRSGGFVQGPVHGYGYRSVTGPQGNTFATGRAWRRR